MIKKCAYKKDGLEIEFEWRLSEDVLKEVKEISSFFKKVSSLPGTAILKKEGYITGLVIPYGSFYELLRSFKKVRAKNVQLLDEFKSFFSLVEGNQDRGGK